MNKIISKSIRVMAITGVAIFAFTGDVFAAPTFLPTSSLEITNTSAAVRVYIENPNELAVVWFEWSEASSILAPDVIAMSNYFGSGFFAARLDGLKPGTTYSYRAATKSGGATVYSPVASFKTTGATPVTTTTTSSQTALGGSSISGDTVSTTDTTSQVSTGSAQAQPVASQTTRSTIKTATVKNSASTVSSNSAKSDTAKLVANNNTASVAGTGSDLLPGTLIGWVALIVIILFVVLLMVMIFESTERRRKVRVMKNANGEEVLIEEEH